MLSQLDFVTWHLHPWWEDQAIGNAVAYLATRHKAVQDRVAKFPGKRLVLGETGWPTLANHGGAVGSPENQARYFGELTAWGFHNNAEFWSFTAFDENWKNGEGAVGGHWGFWLANRQPLPIITGLNTLYPKYMWSENPVRHDVRIETRCRSAPFAPQPRSSPPTPWAARWKYFPEKALGGMDACRLRPTGRAGCSSWSPEFQVKLAFGAGAPPFAAANTTPASPPYPRPGP